MAKYTWPQQEAERLLKNVKDSETPIVFQTGYGPSGLPHIGTFAEVARTLFVIKTVKHLKPEIPTKLIVFSDDMDGLRNLPENVPNHELLRPHLGAPLSDIPDPFEKKESFAAYMNNQLQLFLDSFGFEYEFCSSTATYRGGAFDEGLKRVMDNYGKVKTLFTATISEEKREAWSPFFPICEKCGKIYSTRVTSVNPKDYTLSYSCDLDGELFSSCGHQGETLVTGGKVKVGWKVDWAMRWFAFGVNYEMHGKDLMESAKLSTKICSVLGGKPPILYKYELFLDENGQKISKKIGNGVSMNQWLDYSPLGALLNFLLGNPNKAKKMGLPILPRLVDEYLQGIRSEDPENSQSGLWFTNQVQSKLGKTSIAVQSELPYSLLLNVADSLGVRESSLLYDYAVQYDSAVKEDETFFRELCEKVVSFLIEYTEKEKQKVPHVNPDFFPHLVTLKEHVEKLNPAEPIDGKELQSFIFAITKEHELNQKEWFAFLYATLLNKEQGPKMGPFMAILGQEKALDLLKKALEKSR